MLKLVVGIAELYAALASCSSIIS